MVASQFLPQLAKLVLMNGYGHRRINEKSSRSKGFMGIVQAVERDSTQNQKFEVDRDKAREALQQLDQQLQSLSDKQPTSPKIKASDVKFASDPTMLEEPPEISGSFLTYLAIILFAFTFFYNVLFYAVIKPSIDGPETVPASEEERVPMSDAEILRFSWSSTPENVLQQ